MAWFQKVVLENEWVKLEPLEVHHAEALVRAASDGELWNLWFTSVPTQANIQAYIQKAIDDYIKDCGLAFVVIDKKSNTIIGSTRYTHAAQEDRRLEIGYTWYAQSFQRTIINTACKQLLLTYAFETLDCIAVEFRTHWYNFASRNAILRLGAKQDGVLRNHKIMPNGSIRDTMVFSITREEWSTCKVHLQTKLTQYPIQ